MREAKHGVCISFVCAVSILVCGLAITTRPWPWRTTPGEWLQATTLASHTPRQRPLVAPRCMTAALSPRCTTTTHSMTSLCTVAYRLPGRTIPLHPSDGRACLPSDSTHVFVLYVCFCFCAVYFFILLFIKQFPYYGVTSSQVQPFITILWTYWKCRCVESRSRPHLEDPGPPEYSACC